MKKPIETITCDQIAMDDASPLRATKAFVSIYDDALTYDAAGLWEVEFDTTDDEGKPITSKLEARQDNRIAVGRYVIEEIQRVYDPANECYSITVDEHFKLNIVSKKEADAIYNKLCSWRFGI